MAKMEMQTKWYLKPGQTQRNANNEKRQLALHITDNAWQKVRKHLDRNRLIQDAIDKEHARKVALKEGSAAMIQGWDNSVENIKKRKEEDRQARFENEKAGRIQRFFELRQEQAEIRNKYIEEARKKLYISSGFPGQISSALVQTEFFYEREKQLELAKMLQEHEMDEQAKYAAKVKEAAEQEKLENLEKAKKVQQQNLEVKTIILKEIHDKAEASKSEKQSRIEEELLNIANGEKEFNKLKYYQEEKANQYRNTVNQNYRNVLKEKRHIEEEMALREQECDQIIEIYSGAKDKIALLRKKKEKEIKTAYHGRTEKAAKPVIAATKITTENEQRRLEKAEEEYNQRQKEDLLSRAAAKRRLLQERLDEREAFLKREEQRMIEAKAMPQWNMLNRFKTDEYQKQYELDKKKRQWEATLQYREDLFQQMAAKEETRKEKKQENELLYEKMKVGEVEADRKFFGYAEEALNYVKAKGRTTAFVDRVIQGYKKANDLQGNTLKKCEKYLYRDGNK